MKKNQRRWYWIAFIGIALIAAGAYYFTKSKTPAYEMATVSRGDIVESVSVTGRVKPSDSVTLAFQKGGKINSVNVKVGDHVSVGQSLVQIDTSDLSAQLLQAQANVDTQKAKLDELRRGPRPEEIQIKENELSKSEQDLAYLYSNVKDVLNDAFSKADDAVRAKADQLFLNADSDQIQLMFAVSDFQTQVDATSLRRQSSIELLTWKKELATISSSTSREDLVTLLKKGETHLGVVRNFMARALDLVDKSIGLSATSISTYKANIGTGRTNVSLAITAVTGEEQSISGQEIVVQRVSNELSLLRSGSTAETIAAQEAQVKQAEANVAELQAELKKATLYAPLKGVVTKQDAKVGEIAAPNVPLVSLMSESDLEIEVYVPEIDVGRISVDNTVRITLDAFPGEVFSGKVSYIDPAETIIDGVVNFKVTVLFDEVGSKLRSGLTSNLDIESQKKSEVLRLPEYAIIENDSGKFVRILGAGGTTSDIPVEIGLRSKDGFVELVKGVSEGQQVINVGLKTQGN